MLISSLIDVVQYCPLESIKQSAMKLFNQSIKNIFGNFIRIDGDQIKITHATTRENDCPLFEDYVFFGEVLLRIYEITGNQRFREDLYKLLEYIDREFVDSDKETIRTRAIYTNDNELYPNMEASPFDTSFRSPLATFIGMTRRAAVLYHDREINLSYQKIVDKIVHQVLKNPIQAGEMLKALSYPAEAYRAIRVPISWPTNPKFIHFILYFLPRFVLDYHVEDNEKWEIKNLDQSELQGEGLDNFVETLTPEKN